MDCRFDLEGVVVLVFLGMAAEKPKVSFIIESSGVAGAVPDLAVDFDLGFGIAATVEIAF